ncbi:MAG: tyrosine-type recombinase/integrase [Clostridium sp.]|uniref:tyrosine-type recombinase/integrase n=1 Tax=Clostridium sp. TaxID=1506 RepID=UPI003EE56E5A
MAEKKHVYNSFYTPEKWNQVNKYNKRLMDDYLLEIKSRGLKQSTQEQYFNDLRIVCIYVLDELDNKAFHQLKKKDFRNLVLFFKEKDMSNARTNRLMSAVRSMLTFAEDDDDWNEIEVNQCSKVKGLSKEETREIVFLTDSEIMYIYNTLIEKENYQQATLCAILYESLGRRGEIAQIKYDDISEDRVLCNTMVVAKRGKKYRPIYNDLTKKAYKLYREQRGEDGIESMWINRNKVAADKDTLYDWVVSWRPLVQEFSGEYKPHNVHSWRHSGATNYEDGSHQFCKKIGRALTLTEIQKIMNHSDISTTQSYLKCRDEEVLVDLFSC